MEHKLILEGDFYLTANQLKELCQVVKIQDTSDRDEKGDVTFDGEYGKYEYTINDDLDIVLTKVYD